VTRFARQRLLIIAVLLCQFVTATFAHANMGHAMTLESVASPAADVAPCPNHEHPQPQGEAGHAAVLGALHGNSVHDGCKLGFCKCPCAHTPALAVTVALDIAVAPRCDSAIAYSELSAPGSIATFFRPPI
jgi:hypothetical protein